ncbi:hypothetical protein LPJ63_004582 [Coemansia sp. RSA 2711]|nr:hypothetical protein LPJ63_004582 [Coemansia sp. RSA 2711]
MYTSQQASYQALPSSTRSRRVSSNHSTRPALHQADYGQTSGAGITLQSWARSQVQPAEQRAAPAMFQAHYHHSPRSNRPQSSGRDGEQVRLAVADYFDPYQHTARGQTLNVDAAAKPANAPPSPVMRAVRQARPTTPSSALAGRDSASQQRQLSAKPTQFPPPADANDMGWARMKPRAYTSNNDPPSPLFPPRLPAQQKQQQQQQQQQPRPRVSSMYVDSAAPSAQLHVEVGHAPRQATSALANAAIRDFVDTRSSWAQKSQQQKQQQPWPAAPTDAKRQGRATPTEPANISAERSHLIEFIERQRARTVASTTTTASQSAPDMAPAQAPSSKGSDASERSFKRSTARLAEVEPALLRTSNDPILGMARGPKYSSWYVPPTRTSSAAPDSAHSSPKISPIADLPRAAPSTQTAALQLPPPLPSTRVVPRTRARTVAEEVPQEVLAHGRIPNKPDALLARRSNDALPKPYARHARPDSASSLTQRQCRATGVQTDAPATRTRAVQTASSTIHSDEAVLDLMRQMDALRQGHANQISEYQEQVIDLELLNQDLGAEVEQLTAQLQAKEAAHRQLADDTRQKLEAAGQRVEREIGEVKHMHALKCDELAAQVAMLQTRCSAYRQKLESLGVGERDILALSTTHADASRAEPLQIADQAFIEAQFVETRESSVEADYFRQLMDIERSMENTTIALGFELKRTQAKYLEQAADFIREQMARIQADRPESRLTLRRADSRATVRTLRSPLASPDPAADARLSGSQSPVQSLAASLTQLAASQPLPPLPPNIASAVRPQLRAHQRVVGPEPQADAEDAVFVGRPSTQLKLQQGNDAPAVRRMPASDALGIAQHAAPVSAPSATTGKFESEGDLQSDVFVLSGSPRRAHRSPLAGIGSAFFSSSQESMSTAVASSEHMASATLSMGLLDAQLSSTPTKPQLGESRSRGYIAGSLGHAAGGRTRAPDSDPQAKSASVHWPPRSERRPTSRPQSAAIDTRDMTAEQLLESLKLPTAALATPTRAGSGFGSVSAGSLGRQSPLPRSGSYSDLCRTFPSAPRDLVFDPNVQINIDLGLGPSSEKSSIGSASSRRFKRGPRRRSRSVGAWDRR